MNQMGSFSTFSNLYYELREKYLYELDVYNVEDNKLEPHHVRLRELIRTVDAEDYLVKKNSDSYYGDYMFNTKLGWNDGSFKRVVLYGAGVFGRKIYGDLLEDENINVVHWVDQNYKRMGGCVESPTVIIDEINIDMVFVAILDESVFNSIREYLLSINVHESMIMWIRQSFN